MTEERDDEKRESSSCCRETAACAVGSFCCGSCCCPHLEDTITTHKTGYGPTAHRVPRDLFFLLLFFAFWGGMIYVAVKGFKSGDLDRLDTGTDMLGVLCGTGNQSSHPVLYWPTPLDLDMQLCVDHCPYVTDMYSLTDYAVLLTDTSAGAALRNKLICEYGVGTSINATPSVQEVVNGHCWPPYVSTAVLGRCVPDFTNITLIEMIFDTFFSTIDSTTTGSSTNSSTTDEVTMAEAVKLLIKAIYKTDTITKMFAEFRTSWPYIIAVCMGTVVVAFLLVFLLRFLAGVIVWAIVVLCGCALLFSAVFCWWLTYYIDSSLPSDETLQNPSDVTRKHVAQGFSYALTAIVVLYALIIIAVAKRIKLAVGIIKEAGRCLTTSPSILLFPFIIALLQMAFMTYWIIVTLFLVTSTLSIDQYEPQIQWGNFKPDNTLRWLVLYHLFGLFWNTQFIFAIGQTALSMSFAFWYWVHDKKDVKWFVAFRALVTVVVYHLGTMACGSLIIALVKFARAMLYWVEKKLKKHMDYRIVRTIMCVMKGCFWLLEKVLKFINTNAYIMVGIEGKSFCASARRAFELILANVVRVGVVNGISGFLLFLFQLAVAVGSALVSAIIFELLGFEFWFLPCLLVGVVGYLVGKTFSVIYSMGIDTILLCFCEDISRNDGSPDKPYFMSGALKSFIDSHLTRKLKDKKDAEKEDKEEKEKESEQPPPPPPMILN